MRRKIAAIVVAIMAAVGVQTAVPSPASANSGWMSNYAYLTQSGGSHQVFVQAWFSAWECGLKMCASSGWLDAYMYTYSGTKGNLNRIKEGLSFSGVGVNVSIDTGGGGIGFSDLGSTCQSAEYSYGLAYSGYAESYTGDWVCDADTWGWISSATAANSGGVRYSSTWYNKPVSVSAGTNIQ